MGECSAYSSLQENSKGQFCSLAYELVATWRWPTLAQMNHRELSHMAGAVDDSTINIVVVIIIIIKHALWRKEAPFWGPHDGRQHFGVQIPQKPSKMAFYRHVRAATNGFKMNDVIADWRHWLRSVARSPLLAVPRILFIASRESLLFCIFQWLSTMQRKYQLMHYIRYGDSVLQSLYSICRQSVLQVVTYKDPMCCLLESFKNFETLIHKWRTLGEPFNFAQT